MAQDKIYKCIGASNHTADTRQPQDFYATDPNSLRKFLDIFPLSKHIPILEPACGMGHLSEVLIERGYKVTSSDLYDWGYGKTNVDFFKDYQDWDGTILTNPPYSEGLEFVKKALDIVPKGNLVIMFLKAQFVEGKKRREFFDKYPPKYIYYFTERQVCGKNGKFPKGSAVCYSWWVWEKGYTGEPITRWI